MSLYQRYVLPRLVHASMRQPRFLPYRRRAVQAARGCVLEIGVGSGLNLPLYSQDVTHVIGLEPSATLLAKAREASASAGRPIELVEGTAEAIPLETGTVDTVVTTWTLCTIPDVAAALAEVRRVLGPDGRLLLVEHGRAPDPRVTRWQDRLTPLWRRIAGGCHLNRPIRDLVEGAGFRVEQLETGYMEGPRPMTFTYEGSARPR